MDPHAQPAPANFAVFRQLINDPADHIGGHRKANADRAAIGRQNRGVHTDNFTIQIEQRPARIAPVNCGIRLNIVVINPRQCPVSGRNDSRRDREPLSQRIAHRHHPIAHARCVTVAEADERQRCIRRDLQHCDIGILIGADDLSGQSFTGEKFYFNLIGPFDHVIVCDDEPISRDHKPRPQGRGAAGPTIAATATIFELPKELFKRRALGHNTTRHLIGATSNHGCRGDIHHRGADLIGKIGKCIWQHLSCGL